jgi:hypothetical protein
MSMKILGKIRVIYWGKLPKGNLPPPGNLEKFPVILHPCFPLRLSLKCDMAASSLDMTSKCRFEGEANLFVGMLVRGP